MYFLGHNLFSMSLSVKGAIVVVPLPQEDTLPPIDAAGTDKQLSFGLAFLSGNAVL